MFFTILVFVFWILPAVIVLVGGYVPEKKFVGVELWSESKRNLIWIAMVIAPAYNFDCALEVLFSGPGDEIERH